MTINEAIARVDDLRDNTMAPNIKIAWLEMVDQQVYNEIIKGRVGADAVTLPDYSDDNGERVLLVMGRFTARDFEALFDGTASIPWEDYIPKTGQFPVKGHSLDSKLHSDMLYVYRLEAEICYKNQEIDRQANALTRYNELMDAFAKQYAREHRSLPHPHVVYY